MRKPTTEQIVQAIDVLNERGEHTIAQLVQFGILMEYLIERLQLATDKNGVPLLNLDMDSFPEWGQERFEQITAEAAEAAKVANPNLQGINLDE